jgi:hypothetical protein
MSTQNTTAQRVKPIEELAIQEPQHERMHRPGARPAAPTETLTFTELVALANAWDPWGDPWNRR